MQLFRASKLSYLYITENMIAQVLCSYLEKDQSQMSHKGRNASLLPVLSWSILMVAFKKHVHWPEIFVKVCTCKNICTISPYLYVALIQETHFHKPQSACVCVRRNLSKFIAIINRTCKYLKLVLVHLGTAYNFYAVTKLIIMANAHFGNVLIMLLRCSGIIANALS